MADKDAVVFPRGIPWGAALAGGLVALAAYLVLAILALGLGLGAVAVVSDAEAQSGMITGAMALWWSVSALLALFSGGWVAGRIAGGSFAPQGIFLGVLVWAFVTLGSFYLTTTTVSTVLGGPIAVATDSVYSVLAEVELHTEIAADEAQAPPRRRAEEQLEAARAEEARRLAARAEGAMEAGLWAAVTLLLGGGAAVAGVWFATEPPAWARPRRAPV